MELVLCCQNFPEDTGCEKRSVLLCGTSRIRSTPPVLLTQPVYIFDFVIVSSMCHILARSTASILVGVWWSGQRLVPMTSWHICKLTGCMTHASRSRAHDALTQNGYHLHIVITHNAHIASSSTPGWWGPEGGVDANWRTGILQDAFP